MLGASDSGDNVTQASWIHLLSIVRMLRMVRMLSVSKVRR